MINSKVLFVGPITPDKIKLKVVKTNRKTNSEIRRLIKEKWNEIVSFAKDNGQLLYDGISYRLNKFSFKNEILQLEISKIFYHNRRPLEVLSEVSEKYDSQYHIKGLAIGVLVKTIDDKYVFGIKSGKTVSSLKKDFIGGLLEKKSLIEQSKEELREEFGVTNENIDEIRILGLVQSTTTNIIIIANTKLKITSIDLEQKLINSDGEMAKLEFVEEKNLKKYLTNLGGYKPAVVELLDQVNF